MGYCIFRIILSVFIGDVSLICSLFYIFILSSWMVIHVLVICSMKMFYAMKHGLIKKNINKIIFYMHNTSPSSYPVHPDHRKLWLV